MATKSIIGAEDDENEFLLHDTHIRKQRERARGRYKRKFSDEELLAIRINNLNQYKQRRMRK